jgi:hypothetical protein
MLLTTMAVRGRRRTVKLCVALGTVALAACSALYPEIKSPLRPFAGKATPQDEAPPKGLRWIAFKGATVPRETRDGRKWDSVGGEAPDPYALLFVNDKLLIKTPVESNTLSPTWPDAPKGNFRVSPHDRLRIELWDSNPLNDHPIGLRDLGEVSEDQREEGEIRVDTESGAEVVVAYEPPHAQLGLGFSCELRDPEIVVTRVYEESPASRAGLKAGDQIETIAGRASKDVKVGDLKSILNTPQIQGLAMHVKHPDGAEAEVKLKDGPVFPLASEMTPSGWDK